MTFFFEKASANGRGNRLGLGLGLISVLIQFIHSTLSFIDQAGEKIC